MKVIYVLLLCTLCSFSGMSMAKTVNVPNIVVAQDGSGDYPTLQAAIDAAPDFSKNKFIIYIKNGIYDTEKLIIPTNKSNLVLLGESREETIISYHIYDCKSPESENKCPAEAWELWKGNKDLIRTSATLTIMANDCLLQNLTVRNTAGAVGQALALTLRGDRLIFRNCNFLGYQDTVFLWNDNKRSYFEHCTILGRTDYIYGGGIGFFQSCEIRSFGGGWITAPSTPESQKYGFVFNECRFTYATNSPQHSDDGQLVAIGRPWHKYPKVAILNSNLGKEIHPKGWPTTWNMEYASTSNKLHLYEYNNQGEGADMAQRAKWIGLRALTAKEVKKYSVKRVMYGTDKWNPQKVKIEVDTYLSTK